MQILLLRSLKWSSTPSQKQAKKREMKPLSRKEQVVFSHQDLIAAIKRGSNMKALIQELPPGIDLDAQDDNGKTPLAWACKLGHARQAEALIAAGASSYIHDKNDVSPLMWACKGGHPDIVSLLLQYGADAYARSLEGQGPDCLTFAAEAGCVQSIALLLSRKIGGPDMIHTAAEINGQHPLLMAAENGQLGALKALLKGGAKVNRTDIRGRTALLAAAERGDTPMVEVLLRAGAKVTIFEFENKTTPLMAAASRGADDCVGALLKDPDAFFTIGRAVEVCGSWRIRAQLMKGLELMGLP